MRDPGGQRGIRRQTILYVARHVSGGSLESLCLLVENLDRQRFEPIVFFLRPAQDYTRRRLAEAGVRCIELGDRRGGERPPRTSGNSADATPGRLERFKLFQGPRGQVAHQFIRAAFFLFTQDIPLAGAIWWRLRGTHIDLVHVNSGIRTGRPGVLFALLRRLPCVCHVRMWDTWTAVERLLSRAVDRIVYISRALQVHDLDQGIAAEKGVVVHNAVKLDDLQRPPEKEARTEFGWSSAHFIVGMVGRLDWWKGHEYFLRAMRQVLDKYPNARGLVVGGRELSAENERYADAVMRLAEDLRLQEEVVFTGFRNDVPAIMADLDALTLCSTEPEPFGRVIIEAMAAGAPVIGTASGGVTEIIQHGHTGLLVPAKDSDALACAISELIEDPARASKIASAGRKNARENFTVEVQLAQVQEMYAKLLDA